MDKLILNSDCTNVTVEVRGSPDKRYRCVLGDIKNGVMLKQILEDNQVDGEEDGCEQSEGGKNAQSADQDQKERRERKERESDRNGIGFRKKKRTEIKFMAEPNVGSLG